MARRAPDPAPGAVPDAQGAAAVLRTVHVFRALPEPLLRRAAACVRWRRVRRGQVVFREGEPATEVFLLRSGRVRAVTFGAEGREYVFRIFGPGDLFPHVGLFRNGSYPATAEATEDSVIGAMPREVLRELVRQDGRLALALLEELEEEIRTLQERVRALALQDLKSRVLQVILRSVGQRLTHQEIAAIVGAARESVSRVIADFQRQGILERDRSGRWRVNRSAASREG